MTEHNLHINKNIPAEKISTRDKITALSVLAVFTFLLYGNTLSHDYALDDSMAITRNKFTQKGFSGIWDIFSHNTYAGWHGVDKNISPGGRYRPLSVVSFAVEHQFFGKNPSISHFVNVFLYAVTAILIFFLIQQLSPAIHGNAPPAVWYRSLAFITTLLFLSHPVHTEIVANIKGRDDILAFTFALLTLLTTIRFIKTGKLYLLVPCGILFFLALLSKEGAITFLAIIPLTTWFFIDKNLKPNFLALLPLIIAAALFLGIRYAVLDPLTYAYTTKDLMNNPFAHASTIERYATILYTLGLDIKLLFFPHPLTIDYYPYHIPLIQWHDLRAILPFLIYTGLVVLALIGFRKRGVLSYTILVYLIPLSIVSNILFPVGTFMSERFLYVPSFAFCLFAAWFLLDKIPQYLADKEGMFNRYMKFLPIVLLLIIALFSVKTISRNKTWKNDYTLFASDVMISKNSAFSNAAYGTLMIAKSQKHKDATVRKNYRRTGITHLRKALDIHPTHEEVLKNLGKAYQAENNIDSTIYYLERFTETNPNVFDNYGHLGYLYGKEKKNLDKSIFYFEKAMKLEPGNITPYLVLSNILLANKKVDNAEYYLEKAVLIDSSNMYVLKNLGDINFFKGNYSKTISLCKKALRLNANNKKLLPLISPLYNSALVQQSKIQKEKK